MSSKINIKGIITGHFNTLRDNQGRRSIADLLTFVILPVGFAITSLLVGFNLNKDLSSLLVNFGSIFTALLLSVLVLVYDQESKLEEKKAKDAFYEDKKQLLHQLYYNISYSILCSMALVLFCFVHSLVMNLKSTIQLDEFSFELNYGIFL